MAATLAAIALGSNLDDRRAHLDFAVAAIARRLRGVRVSSYLETDPVGVSPQAKFLNAVCVGEADEGPAELLEWLQSVERERGRTRPGPGAPRTLDLDLILHGQAIVGRPDLHVPHPRFRARRFVLEPLAEVAPDIVDPVTGLTAADLLRKLDQP